MGRGDDLPADSHVGFMVTIPTTTGPASNASRNSPTATSTSPNDGTISILSPVSVETAPIQPSRNGIIADNANIEPITDNHSCPPVHQYLALPRLSSIQLVPSPAPWDWTPATPLPAEIRGVDGKKARDTWANNPNTVSNFYTGYEGLNENLRISQGKEGEGNPPTKEHFLVADFDFALSNEDALAAAKKFIPAPNRLEKTFSGNWRAVWFLESSINIPSYEFAKFFKKNFSTFAFAPERLMSGFDKGAWAAPERFWTNSGEWFNLHDEKIPAVRSLGWQFLASQKFNWKKAFNSVAIPAEVAAEELAKKYPRFSNWPGEFVLDSQGPTFWVDGSNSPKSAIVRETGIQTFSDHAFKGFYTWTELLGAAFTKAYEADAVGRAVEGIYYDSQNYWALESHGWQSYNATSLTRLLKVDRGVCCLSDKSGVHDIDRTIRHIERTSSVVGAAPFVCRRPGLINVNGDRFLNTHTKPFMAPAPGPQVWGAAGNFPWVSTAIDSIFNRGDYEQVVSIISWAAHLYQSGINFEPRSGLIVVIAGAAGVGKSMFVYGILGAIFGGVGEAGKLLSGEDTFGSENFSKALWCMDDNKSSSDYSSHRKLSEGLKRAAANDAVQYHKKYAVPCVISWFGRIILCLNKDAESLRMLPDMEISILDKISLYHTADTTIEYPTRKEIDAILVKELPFFCAYLRDYVIPPRHIGTNRFGVKPWKDAEIFGQAKKSSPETGLLEIVNSWRTFFFLHSQPNVTDWQGGATDLVNDMILQNRGMSHSLHGYSSRSIGRLLGKLAETPEYGISVIGERNGSNRYRIARQDDLKTNEI